MAIALTTVLALAFGATLVVRVNRTRRRIGRSMTAWYNLITIPDILDIAITTIALAATLAALAIIITY